MGDLEYELLREVARAVLPLASLEQQDRIREIIQTLEAAREMVDFDAQEPTE